MRFVGRRACAGNRSGDALTGNVRSATFRELNDESPPIAPGIEDDGMKAVKAGYSLEKHVEGESRQLGAPILRWELAKEIAELWRQERWRPNGHSGKTLVKYPNVRVVLIVMARGARMENHEAVSRVSIQTLQGRVFVKLSDQRIDLPCECLLELERLLPHDIEALEESAVLLTLAFGGAARRVRPSPKP